MLSNRGGRPLDHAPAPIAVIPEIVKTAAGTRMIDSDFRRGSDVGKAVASGAKAVMLERAPLYGLAAGGEGDVSEVIDIFKDEIDRTLALVERSYSGESRCHLHRRSPDLRCRRHLLPISRSPPCVGGGEVCSRLSTSFRGWAGQVRFAFNFRRIAVPQQTTFGAQ